MTASELLQTIIHISPSEVRNLKKEIADLDRYELVKIQNFCAYVNTLARDLHDSRLAQSIEKNYPERRS